MAGREPVGEFPAISVGVGTMQRRLLIVLAWGLLVAPVFRPALAEERAEKTVRLAIDYGDGVQRVFTGLAWKEKMTVFDLLEAAAKHPRGIKLKHQGKGATLLVTAIDELANEGSGKNWIYEVNEIKADRSCAIYELKAQDAVLWRFTESK